MRTVPVLDLNLCPLTLDGALDVLSDAVEARTPRVCSVVNAGKWSRMQHEPDLARAVQDSDWVFADGASIQWASRALGQAVPERVCGVDLMAGLLERAAQRGWRPFLLGSTHEGIALASGRAVACHPGLSLAGWHHGYFADDEQDAVAAAIRDSQPDLLLVGMGTPRQERFIARWAAELGVPVSLGVGGGLDVLAGTAARAPAWMQRAHLEWAFRLGRRPRALWRRALLDPIKLAWATGRAATTSPE